MGGEKDQVVSLAGTWVQQIVTVDVATGPILEQQKEEVVVVGLELSVASHTG